MGPIFIAGVLADSMPPTKKPKRKEPRGPAGGDETVSCRVSGLRWRGRQSTGGTQLFEPVEWVSRREPGVGSVPIQR